MLNFICSIFMKRIYKYEVYGVTYNDGIPEGTVETFNTIKNAIEFVNGVKNSIYAQYNTDTIFKYEENGNNYRYIKRIWKRDKHGNWYSTRHINKYRYFLEI